MRFFKAGKRWIFHTVSIFILTYMIVSLPEPSAVSVTAQDNEIAEKEQVVTVSTSSRPGKIRIIGPSEEQLQTMETAEVIATGYTAGYESTGKTPDHPEYGITYSGIRVRRDHLSTIAADLTKFPLGTVLWIPDYGYGIVSDIGGAIKGEKIDLYFETEEDVYRHWGKKKIKVYIVEKGTGELTEEMFGEKMEAYAS